MPFSHHSHSGQFCHHAKDTLEEVVQTAIAKKMSVLALTEHMPREKRDLYPEEVRDASFSPNNLFLPCYIHFSLPHLPLVIFAFQKSMARKCHEQKKRRESEQGPDLIRSPKPDSRQHHSPRSRRHLRSLLQRSPPSPIRVRPANSYSSGRRS